MHCERMQRAPRLVAELALAQRGPPAFAHRPPGQSRLAVAMADEDEEMRLSDEEEEDEDEESSSDDSDDAGGAGGGGSGGGGASDADLAAVMALEQSLAAHPGDYNLHAQYVALLSRCGLRGRLRAARDAQARLFPLTARQWRAWIDDELDAAARCARARGAARLRPVSRPDHETCTTRACTP